MPGKNYPFPLPTGLAPFTVQESGITVTSSDKPHLLYLCHRIPYPPDKGDKIRSWHLLRYLVERYEVHLGTFIDDENDWQYVEFVKSMCADTCFIGLNPTMARIRSLTALPCNRPLTLDYYRSQQLVRWVAQYCEQFRNTPVIVFSSAVAQFAMNPLQGFSHRVIDFVDIDSDKWRQYAKSQQAPMRWVYQREAKKLFAAEKAICRAFDHSLFVSKKEADTFCDMAPELAR